MSSVTNSFHLPSNNRSFHSLNTSNNTVVARVVNSPLSSLINSKKNATNYYGQPLHISPLNIYINSKKAKVERTVSNVFHAREEEPKTEPTTYLNPLRKQTVSSVNEDAVIIPWITHD